MDRFKRETLIGCALAPVAGFFPVEIHYGLMRSLDFFGNSERSEIVSAGPPGISYQLLKFLQDWLPMLTAILFALGAFMLRSSVRRREEPRHFALILFLFFLGGVSQYLIPHWIPFFFTTIMLAILANIRVAWVEGNETAQNMTADSTR